MVLDFLNSANVIVQNRMTGQLEEEKMQVYVRLAIRLLYKGFLSEMESESGMRTYHPLILLSYFSFHPPAHRLLKVLSFRQGVKYDDPKSAKEIPNFIKFHHLNVDELLDPLDLFSEFSPLLYLPLINVLHQLETFNQFFYRFVLSSFNHPHIRILKSVFTYFCLRKLEPSARPIDAPSDPNNIPCALGALIVSLYC